MPKFSKRVKLVQQSRFVNIGVYFIRVRLEYLDEQECVNRDLMRDVF